MENNISFILLTYDGADFLWNDYFRLIKKYWPDFSHEFSNYYMTSNKKNFIFEEDLVIKNISLDNSVSLSDRIRHALELCNTDFVFISIDDYFLKSVVDVEKFNECLEIIKKDKKIDCIEFENFRSAVKKHAYNDYLNILKKKMFLFNLQNAIWRKESLLKLLRKDENGWKMEYYGSVRAALYNFKILTLKKGTDFVFNYDFGWLVQRGKFDKITFDYFVDNENVDRNLANKVGFRERGQNKKVTFVYKMKHLMLALFSFIKR